jgi:hypothetical protein
MKKVVESWKSHGKIHRSFQVSLQHQKHYTLKVVMHRLGKNESEKKRKNQPSPKIRPYKNSRRQGISPAMQLVAAHSLVITMQIFPALHIEERISAHILIRTRLVRVSALMHATCRPLIRRT